MDKEASGVTQIPQLHLRCPWPNQNMFNISAVKPSTASHSALAPVSVHQWCFSNTDAENGKHFSYIHAEIPQKTQLQLHTCTDTTLTYDYVETMEVKILQKSFFFSSHPLGHRCFLLKEVHQPPICVKLRERLSDVWGGGSESFPLKMDVSGQTAVSALLKCSKFNFTINSPW